MISVKELKAWIDSLPEGATVAVDDGGLELVHWGPGGPSGFILVGGEPDDIAEHLEQLRRERAEVALSAYLNQDTYEDKEADRGTVVADLLADLMTLRGEEQWADDLRRANSYHEADLEGV